MVFLKLGNRASGRNEPFHDQTNLFKITRKFLCFIKLNKFFHFKVTVHFVFIE